jgi:spore coat protein CotH
MKISLLLLVLLAAAARPLPAGADDVFNPSVLHDLQLTVNARDLQSLREHFTENAYYPADLRWRDVVVRNIGIRSRGFGSRNGVKLGLRLDFNHYVSGQRFAGVSSLVLDNLWQDPSMIREAVAMAFIARVGEAASRESFARLFINGEFQGLYAVVEEPGAAYLDYHLGGHEGLLFEYHWLRPYHFEDLGSRVDDYAQMFERRTHETDPAGPAYAPLVDMLHAVNRPLDGAWRSDVERFVDLPQMIRYAAIEAFLAEDDGFTGYDGINNFYVYRQPGTTRHMFLPWDRDHALTSADYSVFLRLDQNRLLAAALTFDDLHALYVDTVRRCAAAARDGGWLEAEVARAAALIAGAARADTRVPYTADDHRAGVESVLDFARRRPAAVLTEVGGGDRPPSRARTWR